MISRNDEKEVGTGSPVEEAESPPVLAHPPASSSPAANPPPSPDAADILPSPKRVGRNASKNLLQTLPEPSQPLPGATPVAAVPPQRFSLASSTPYFRAVGLASCPLCGDKKRTDSSGRQICAIKNQNCPFIGDA